jgi:amino acid adenylation domain-containing protein
MPIDTHPAHPFVRFENTAIDQSIPARFEQQAARYPDRLAVVSADLQFTYAELNRVSNRIARAVLSHLGEGEEPVALLFKHGAFLIAAILGVLKAGKIYMSLDPADPDSRMGSMLEDSQAKLLLTNREHLSRARQLVQERGQKILNCDDVDTNVGAGNLDLSMSPEACALMLYTSGTTGRPKGVVHSHRNILVETRNYTNYARLCSEDRFTLWHSCSYTNSIRNLYAALLNGGALHMHDLATEGFLPLAEWMRAHRITIVHTLPTTFRCFCQTLAPDATFPALRVLRLGGESINRDDVRRYQRHFSPHCLLMHAIGPTETLDIGYYSIAHDWHGSEAKVPLGYAVPDKELLVLDEAGREVGPDQIGEIAVRSKYLALGYWRRPDLTEAAFTLVPGGGDERLYRTGDLGVMRPDGCMTHMGRKDFQIKIRGYRVEVAEIEGALLDLDSIDAAVVQAQADVGGGHRLVAYVVPAAGKVPTVSELRRALAQTLPDYMMPSAFVFLETLPLSSTGKIDRRSLPAPDRVRPHLKEAFVAPRNPVEDILAKIWATLLDLELVGIHDNFFNLGGHSLLATQVISRVRDTLQVELTLPMLFEAPTVAGLAEYVGVARQADRGLQAEAPKPVARGPQFPLSFAQERLWFLEQLEPNSSVHNIPTVYRLTGSLNVAALEQSLNEIVRRHGALRSSFGDNEGQPIQVMGPVLSLTLPVVDLRELTETEQRGETRRLTTEEVQRPFDLSRGPLVRLVLVRLTEHEYLLLLVIHHLVFDGWSAGILARELSSLYTAYSRGQPSPLSELPIQYADFAQWQREWLRKDVLEEHLAYWKKQLAGVPKLQMPTDRPRPRVQTVGSARHYFVLSKPLSAELKSLSNRHGVTLFMTLFAAYQTLLHRYTGQNDIVIGSPVGGRNRSELEGLIGFFYNMLVLRIDLSGNPTFRELLVRVREVCLGAYAHQDLPFEKLVEGLRPERDFGYNPFFQVTFALQNAPAFHLELAGLEATDVDVDPGTARFDLHLFMREQESGLQGYVDYNTDLFNVSTIERMTAHFQGLLEGVVANPNEPIERLPILTEAERHQLLVEWNATDRDYPRDKCIHQLFEAQVERTPDAVAVVFEDQRLTYQELDRRANQLAHYLQNLGVGPEVLVGICIGRSLDMVVALLGILKAGGAYVPLDPEYPNDRLAFMLGDTQVPVLLTQQRLVTELVKAEGTKTGDPRSSILDPRLNVVCLDKDWEVIARESDENPVSEAAADNLAYIMYTSGSTGKPKGVGVPHRGVVRLAKGTDYASLNSQEVFLQLAPVSFDASTFEIWGSLLNGARLVVFSAHTPSLEELGQVLQRYQITTLWLTAGLFHQMVESNLEGLRHVRQLLTGGDVLSFPHVRKALQELRECRVINGYGPTESTTFTCCYPMADPSQVVAPVPIGRPIANTRVYILDHYLNPVPIGICGELYIGGEGLARGYLNHPELTAETFIPHPFNDKAGARLYKTGDLARYLPDGNIEFIGRIDHQVKIRGFRIELGEIEAVLRQHPAVRETVVIARQDVENVESGLRTGEGGGENPKSANQNLQSRDKCLVAYVMPSQQRAPTVSELRDFMRAKLPEYMVPSAFMMMSALPLTPSGKVDRRLLPAPDQTRPEIKETFVSPRTPLEEMLAGIWAQLLKLERVGIDDNFFDLGGHSLLAIQIISRVRTTFQIALPLQSLFETPTVAGLANVIDKAKDNAAQHPLAAIVRVPRRLYSVKLAGDS